ncbi:MAG TPA: hypothetical protein VF017_00115 [Thermoanaerobaculia bacterium]|nr:hypothetical protein [Thermoanaerobaculia bacterium]
MFQNIRSNKLLIAFVAVSFVAAFALVWTLEASALEPGGKKAQHNFSFEGKGSAKPGTTQDFSLPGPGGAEDICAVGVCGATSPTTCECSCYGTFDCCLVGCIACCSTVLN